eukprot:3128730-Prymnesium_polylepis.1
MVCSNGRYLGLDPLNTISSHGRGEQSSWKMQLDDAAARHPVGEEARRLFYAAPDGLRPDRGA